MNKKKDPIHNLDRGIKWMTIGVVLVVGTLLQAIRWAIQHLRYVP